MPAFDARPFLLSLSLAIACGGRASSVPVPGPLLLGPAAGPADTVFVRGAIVLAGKAPPLHSALVHVRIVDVSHSELTPTLLGEQQIGTGGRLPPFAFRVAVPSRDVTPDGRILAQVRIEEGGTLRYINTRPTAVITRNAPVGDVRIVVAPVLSPAEAARR